MNAENNSYVANAELAALERKKYDITIGELVTAVLNKLWVLILAALIGAMGAYFLTIEFTTPVYRSTARVYIINRQSSIATSMNDLNSAVSIKDDFRVLIRSNDIYRQVLTQIGENPRNYRSLASKLSLDNNSSRFVDITITDTDPLRAKMLADAFANVSRVRAKEVMGVEDITIEEYGEIPTSPSDPNMTSNIMLGILIGLVISAGAIVLLYMFNDNIRSEEDIEKMTGLCVLGNIPDISLLRRVRSTKNTIKKPVRK